MEAIPQETLREWREACERTDECVADGRMRGKFCDMGCREECVNLQAFRVISRTALPRLLDAYESAQREVAALRERVAEVEKQRDKFWVQRDECRDEIVKQSAKIALAREERDEALELAETRAVALDDLAHKMEYKGNSVAYIYDKMTCYRNQAGTLGQCVRERDAEIALRAKQDMKMREVLLDLREILTGSTDYYNYYTDEVAQIDDALRERTAELDARNAQGETV